MSWFTRNDLPPSYRRTKALPQFVEVRSSGLAHQPEGVALSLSKWLPCTEGGIYPAPSHRIASGICQEHPARKADRDQIVAYVRAE